MTSDPQLASAIDAVRAAAIVARKVQQDLDEIRQIAKDDRSPVTVADFAVQAIVTMILGDHVPDLRLVGEESAGALRGDDRAAIRRQVVEAVRSARPGVTETEVLDAIDAGDHDGTSASFWTLDPVDGTKGFLRGQQYAIALARIDDGVVTCGVMGCPNLPRSVTSSIVESDTHGVTYAAVRGGGAVLVDGARHDPIHAATRLADGVRVCESVEKGHSKQSDTARIVDAIGGAGAPVRLDSQCKYAIVARGDADAYLRLPTRADYVEKIWDHAAGSLIAEEAGAIVTDVSGASLDFGHGSQLERNRGVICATPAIHGRIIDAISQLGLTAPE